MITSAHLRPSLRRPMTTASAIILALLVPRATLGQSNQDIRPSQDSTSSGQNNFDNSYDSNEGTYAGGSKSRPCTSEGEGRESITALWKGFPEGYSPLKLKIKWNTSGIVTKFSGSGRVDVTVEYSTDSGEHWTHWTSEEFSQVGPGTTSINHTNPVAEISLQAGTQSHQVQLRVTHMIQITQCGQGIDPTNVTGSVTVYDVRIEAGPPYLTVSPNPVTRGNSTTFTVNNYGSGTMSNWVFDSPAASFTRTVSTGSQTWARKILTSGEVSVDVTIAGTTYTLHRTLGITARNLALPQ